MPKIKPKFKGDDAPKITLPEVTEGRDWDKDLVEFAIEVKDGPDVNAPLIAANPFIQLIKTLQSVINTPGSEGSMKLLQQEMEAISICRVKLEELSSEAWTMTMLMTTAS
jgi:hypothetical protein